MNQLTHTQIDELKDSLLKEKKGLEAHFEAVKDDEDDSLLDSSGELSSFDNHPADLGTETFERGRDQAIDATMDEQLELINRSLDQMEAGDYGECEVCGAYIPFERLQAIPYGTTCIEHANQAYQDEVQEDRPVEEQVMTRPPSGAGENRQKHVGHFDDADAWKSVESYGISDSPAMAAERDVESYDQLSSDKTDKSDQVEGTDAVVKE